LLPAEQLSVTERAHITTLTAVGVAKLKPDSTRREVPDAGCPRLYLVVQPSGRKSFAVRYRYQGRSRKLTLPPGLSLAQARAAATAALAEVEKGNDPSVTKHTAKEVRQAAAANTFRAVAENYLRREGGKLRSADWQQRLLGRLVYPQIGDLPIASIKRKAVVTLLDRIEDSNGPVMAHSTLAVVRRIMSWHSARDEDYASPIVRGMSRIKPKERARSRILSDDELRSIWKATERTDPFSAYLKFLLLTACRRDEARELVWDEIKNGVWLLPAIRNKTKVDLVRPLSGAALKVIEAQPHIVDCPFAFTATGGGPITSLSRYKKALDLACDVTGWTLHDLRRTARSLMSRAGVTSDHAERCLGHVIGGVRGTYDRHQYLDEMRHAYEALAAQIERIVNPPDGNVVSLRG
jgi:integrase